MDKLQKISNMSKEDAKKLLLSEMEKELVVEKANLIRDMESKVKEEADKNAKEVIGYAIQKCAADHTSETTVSIVSLPMMTWRGDLLVEKEETLKH